ncbi:DUF547 domain-containing protein [Halobacteriovorax sp. GB3]|uniref:DUF547 domain-containing protein n=1 Tax=Halobacteriovorax sp. GB3 TaxID=2719615 RepID=UPI00235E7D9C|nr:DUF547 domain-containing protein [Halobacteriovorax sp. GB3]MDD0853268.1 DUF547 domain-containing protein [Halobacteriovorax sp. GB3]
MKIIFFFGLIYSVASWSFDHSHQKFSNVLEEHVLVKGTQSKVNYSKLVKSSKELESYLNELSSLSEREFKSFTNEQQLAFLINAYNAFTLKLVIDNYPIRSLKDIGTLFKSPWKKTFFTLFGKERHLDEIEHDMIRKNFNEPRIHFALVCASISCPPLSKEAYQADKLNEQLDQRTYDFINDKKRNRLSIKKKRLYLSKIFQWYEQDFLKDGGSIQGFIRTYIDDTFEREALDREDFRVRFERYDWSLNDLEEN